MRNIKAEELIGFQIVRVDRKDDGTFSVIIEKGAPLPSVFRTRYALCTMRDEECNGPGALYAGEELVV